jgi:spore coat protein H
MNPLFVLDYIKKLFVLLLLTLVVPKACAQGIITINPLFCHADSAKKMLLVNAPIHQLLPAVSDTDSIRVLVSGSRQYMLLHPVAKLSTRISYRATSQGATYTIYFTQVPVLAFSTRHQIVDAPSVYAHLVLTDTTGIRAQSATGIEFRGDYSQIYPKKSLELSLWSDTLGAASRDLSLLGMRTDNKWNLQAMYNDQARVRLKVANELWQDINHVYYKDQEPSAHSGIDFVYTEVFINDSYQGIYALTERMDRKQLKLKKYSQGIKGELYKGAISGVAGAFLSAPTFDNNSLTWGGFEYKEPSEVTDWTNLHGFVNFVVNSSDNDFYSQYKSRFNLDNAVDYYLFINLLRATDNMVKNFYIARYKTNEPYFYLPWDLDGVLGNDWSGANANIIDGILSNGFYDRLAKDYSANGFQAALSRRWSSLRTSVVTEEYISAKIKANNEYLVQNNVYEREERTWVHYQYDPNQASYPIAWLKSRLAYLDAAFKPTTTLSASKATDLALHLYPNPTSEYVCVESKSIPCQLSIQDVAGKTVLQSVLTSSVSRIAVGNLPKGLYLVNLKTSTVAEVHKLLIQ